MISLDAFATGKLADLEARDLRRKLRETEALGPVQVGRDGRELLSFCGNDYLNLTQHTDIKRAAIEAIERYGAGAGGSRLVTGNHPLFRALERRLADLKQTDDAVVFGSGYLANLGIIPCLAGPGDLILSDELSHACLLAGAGLSKAETFSFRHNDLDHLEALLKTHRDGAKACLILTDGVFSMYGDLAPLGDMAVLARRFDAWLMSDDAHGVGVLGQGRGSSFVTTEKADVPLQMGTLSKAIGSYGGYLCASRPVVDLIRTRARTLIYSTGLAPASVAAAIAALDLIAREPDYAATPLRKARLFTESAGLPVAQSPIVPLLLGDAKTALAASQLLEDEGYLVTAIRPPTVPEGTARLRFTFMAMHDDGDIERLARLVRDHILPAILPTAAAE